MTEDTPILNTDDAILSSTDLYSNSTITGNNSVYTVGSGTVSMNSNSIYLPSTYPGLPNYYPPMMSTAITNFYSNPYAYTPSNEQLKELGTAAIVDRMVTKVTKDDTVVICVDSDATTEQLREIADSLSEKGINGVVIRGARAGTGFPYKGLHALPDEDKRVDILARIGELWASRPDLALTDLLKWYDGVDMTDEAFAAAVEVHFTKVTNEVSSNS